MTDTTAEAYLERLAALDRDYKTVVKEMVRLYPVYETQPQGGAGAGVSQEFARYTAALHEMEAELFALRDAVGSSTIMAMIKSEELDGAIAAYDKVDKKMAKRLGAVETQLASSKGRLHDAVFLYREAYISTALIGCAAVAGAYLTYQSVRRARAR